MGIPATIASFTVLPTTYSSASSSTSKQRPTTHYIYARKHEHKNSSARQPQPSGSGGVGETRKESRYAFPEGRTMFVVNVPVDATERELVVFFRWAGVVERVVFLGEGVTLGDGEESDGSDEEEEAEEAVEDEEEEDEDEDESEGDTTKKSKSKKKQQQKEQVPKIVPLPSTSLRALRQTGQTAYVIFLESSSLIRALAPSFTPRPWPHSSTDTPSGLLHYTALYTSLRPSLPSIAAYTTSVLEVYDYTLAQKKQKSEYRKGEAVVDEDGFTVVVRGGAYGKTLGGGVGVARKGWGEGGVDAGNLKGKKKKESKEGMYAFQRHEKNRKRLLDLRAKFEEDKAKIAKHREQRKFKPY